MASSIIKNFVAKALFKKKGAIANNKAVEFSAKDIEQRLIKFNIDPNSIRSEGELKQVLNFVQQAEDRAFTERFGNMLRGSRFGKSGDVVDMTGKKLDPDKNIIGGTQATEETIKENLMKTDNPFSDLVKTTEKGPKTIKEREAEILERMNRENKETVQRIKNRKLISEAIDNVSPGFVKGDKKYNAEIVAEEIATRRGLDYSDMDTKKRLDIYDEAFNALTDLDKNFATGGRAGYSKGIGPLFNNLLRFFSQNSPKQAGQKYLKSVKDRAQRGDVKSLAPELGAVSATGIFVNRRMENILDNMNEQDKKIDLENYIKELDADPFFKEYPELKDKMIENYKEVFGETRADGGRAGFNVGGAPSIVLNPDERERGKVFETSDVKEAVKEIIKRGIGPLDMAEIPLTEKGRLTFGFDGSGGRQISGGLDLLGGELDFGAGSGRQGKGIGFQFRKKFGPGAKGKRINRKEGGGMSRRQFMKIMGGLAALPIVGKFFKGAKPVAKVAGVATKSVPAQPPEYFFDLAAKIKILGKESSTARRERMIEVDYKNYTLEEDLVTGDMTIIKRKGDPEFGYEEEVMALRKGQADEMTKGKKPPDEYEEVTVRPDPDGKMKDVEDGIEPESVKEIMEEVGKGGGNLDQTTLEEIARGRLASGGVAMMLGE